MNTTAINAGSTKTGTPTNTFAWLLRREYWEYRGGFFWTPIIIAIAFLALFLIAVTAAELFAKQHGINVNGIQLDMLTQSLSPENTAKLNAGMDIGLLTMCFPIGIAMFFVVFFYLLGALYNDRSDRSVLFWKSLPISDTQTVLAKVVAACVIAPVLAALAMIALQLGFLVLMTLFAAINGVNAVSVLWSPMRLIRLWTTMAILIPVNALWALPTIGWLLLVSSFVRSKPFLWAVLLPVIVGVIVSSAKVMQDMAVPSAWFWKHVVARILFSVFPGGWIDQSMFKALEHMDSGRTDLLAPVLSLDTIQILLTSPEIWIGAVAGVAMIAGAIYFRRRRTEAYA
jgi:ABC-2 type transport system permease protein